MTGCKSEDYQEWLKWVNGLSYYERDAYFTLAEQAVKNGDTGINFVIMSRLDGQKVNFGKKLVLIFTGGFSMFGENYVEGVIRIDPAEPDKATAVGRLAGDDLLGAIDSFVPNRDGDGITCPHFPEIMYKENDNYVVLD
jgi:hypothetical protein